MSQQEWTYHLARLNYAAGQLAARADAHVRCAQVRELADCLESDVAWHAAQRPSSFGSPLLGGSAPVSPRALFSPTTVPTPSDCVNIETYFAQPVPTLHRTHNFESYTKDSPCPDTVAPSGSKSKGKRKAAP